MMKGVTGKAMFNQRLEAQSEFKKPYLSDEYPEMEQFFMPPFPNFAWPDWIWPDFSGPIPESTDEEWFDAHMPEGLQGCSIFCVGNGGNRECGGVVKCKFSRYYSERMANWSVLKTKDGIIPVVDLVQSDDGYWNLIVIPRDSWNDCVPNGKQSFKLKVKLDQGNGITCTDEVTVYCYPCPVDPVLTFDDDNTPDTIVKNSHIDVYVAGGKAPFTYVVSGTGYTWNGNGAASYESSNRNEQLDCADGD